MMKLQMRQMIFQGKHVKNFGIAAAASAAIFGVLMNVISIAENQTATAAADSVALYRGKVAEVEGLARRLPRQAQDWVTAVAGSEVISGDKVRTLRDSRAELELKKLNIIRMAPMTTIDIVKLYEETKAGRDETAIHIEKGDIWALVSDIKETEDFNISTPVAGAAITGTKFRINVADDSSTVLKVYKGEVRVTNAPGNTVLVPQELPQQKTGKKQVSGPKRISGPRQVSFEEWYYIVKKMQEIRISKDGQLVASGFFRQDDPDEQTDWVLWNKRRDQALGK